MKKIKLLAAALFLINSVSFAQFVTGSFVIVRVYEITSSMGSPYIIISYGDGRTEVIDMEPSIRKNQEKNLDIINGVLTKIKKAGYTITTSNAGVMGPNSEYMISAYVFAKKESD